MAVIKDNLKVVYQKIAEACRRSARDPKTVSLLAVSKKFSGHVIEQAALAGQLHFAENYVQEACEKIAELKVHGYANLSFDLIGNLQRNKVKDAVGVFNRIQTVDRFELAEEISKVAAKKNLVQKVLIQVNISEEKTKSGAMPEETLDLAIKIGRLANISLEGLMSIGKFYEMSEEDSLRREEFVKMRELRDKIQRKSGLELCELSMGMSHDYELAIEEGATIVRVGSAIFGERGVL